MAWVRYDDQFPINPKVTAVTVEDPGALALHLLANTWSNTTKTPGYVPPHQPTALLHDRGLAEKWADQLVRAGLWHVRGQECGDCKVEYAGLSKSQATAGGWVFHHAQEYRPPARDRVTPGTPADLSEKRRAAGRKGGQASAAKRAGQANQAKSVSKSSNCSSNSVSPVPVPMLPTEAKTYPADAGTQPTLTGMPPPITTPRQEAKANDVVKAFVDACREAGLDDPTTVAIKRVAKDAKRLLDEEKVAPAKLLAAAKFIAVEGWQSLDSGLRRLAASKFEQPRTSNRGYGHKPYINPAPEDFATAYDPSKL